MEILTLLTFYYIFAILIAWVALSSCVAKTAKRMNRCSWAWLLFSICFSPVLAAFMVHCLGSINEEEIEKPAWSGDGKDFAQEVNKSTEELELERILHEADERIAEKKRKIENS